ncbi:MAG TPA: hypothetical protein VF438_02575 [Candidatus Paceibacterota bacterium]
MKTYFSAFAVLFAVAVGNFVGQEYNISFQVPFYDVYLHFGGGLGIAMLLHALLISYKPDYFHTARSRRLVLWGVLVVGLVWELFEAYFGIAGAPVGTKAYYTDTIKDLIDDMLGGALAVWLVAR